MTMEQMGNLAHAARVLGRFAVRSGTQTSVGIVSGGV